MELSHRDEVVDFLKKNPPKRTRLTKNITSGVYHKIKWLDHLGPLFIWGMNLKPGDSFWATDCTNHRVEKVEIYWLSASKALTDPWKKEKKKHRGVNGHVVECIMIKAVDGFTVYLDCYSEARPAVSMSEIRSKFGDKITDFMVQQGIIDENGFRLRFASSEERDEIDKIAGFWSAII